jgi:hypothetical protein
VNPRLICVCAQEITGLYTVQDRLQAVVDGVDILAGNVTMLLTQAERLATYDAIHPLYIQVPSLIMMMCLGISLCHFLSLFHGYHLCAFWMHGYTVPA